MPVGRATGVGAIVVVALFASTGFASAQDQQPSLAATSASGGIVSFDGPLVGRAFTTAQRHCDGNRMDAVPLGFFTIEGRRAGEGRTLMTFQCVPSPRHEAR